MYEPWQFISKTNPNIYLETSPAWWVGDPEYTKIKRVKLTCGGGMGGSVWYDYVLRDSDTCVDLGNEKLIEYTRWDGTKVTYNPRYIVCIENFTMVRAKLIRDPKYFKDDGGKYLRRRYLVEDGVKVTFVDNKR